MSTSAAPLFVPWDDETRTLLEAARRGLMWIDRTKAREPSCQHRGGENQPASACRICKDGPALAEWRGYWQKQKARATELLREADDA